MCVLVLCFTKFRPAEASSKRGMDKLCRFYFRVYVAEAPQGSGSDNTTTVATIQLLGPGTWGIAVDRGDDEPSRLVPRNLRHGRTMTMRSLTMTRQRDFLFRYRIFRWLFLRSRRRRRRCRSRATRAVVFHQWRTQSRCRGTIRRARLIRAHTGERRACPSMWPDVLGCESLANRARFAWPGPAPTSGITLKLTPARATTRTPDNRASSALFLSLSLSRSLSPPALFAFNSHKPPGRPPPRPG